METYFSNESVKRCAKSSDTIAQVVTFISCSSFSVIVSIFLLHMINRQIHRQNYAILIFIHSSFCVLNFLPACIPKIASFTHDTKGEADGCQYSSHLLYCGVQVLPRYPGICMNVKKFDIETMPLLSSCCATTVYCKGLIQTTLPLPQ